MTTITASEVNKLRQMTGAGMMDCKNALVETNGDFEAAVDFLRKKGAKIAAKRADREATEGCVIAMTNDARTTGVIVLVSCETDFVAKNENFVAMAKNIATVALENQPADVDALKLMHEGDNNNKSKASALPWLMIVAMADRARRGGNNTERHRHCHGR